MLACFTGLLDEPRSPTRADTATSTNGRVQRILVVGPDEDKTSVVDDMRSAAERRRNRPRARAREGPGERARRGSAERGGLGRGGAAAGG